MCISFGLEGASFCILGGVIVRSRFSQCHLHDGTFRGFFSMVEHEACFIPVELRFINVGGPKN